VEAKRIYVDHGFAGKTMTRDGQTHAAREITAGWE
jgi:hypothetical protein